MSNVKRPLNRSVIIVCAVFVGLLCVAVSVSTTIVFTNTLYDRYQKQLSSIVSYVETRIDHDDMAKCAETFEESETYKEFQAFVDDFIDHYEDLHYLYIITASDPDDPVGIYPICSANSTYEKEHEPENVIHIGEGEEGLYPEEEVQHFRKIQSGTDDVYYVNSSIWGVDYTLARPLLNSNGRHYGLLCADISIDDINESVTRNVYFNIIMIVVLGAVFITLLILWMRKNVTRPIKQLENSVTEFANASTGKRNPDDLLYVPPDIHTKNEVESLTKAITKRSADMREYVIDIVAAEDEAKNLQPRVSRMNDIVYRDSLTSVKNRAAYEMKIQALNWDIVNNSAEFAIVLADVNNLKGINDIFGHEKGNEYIVGACKIICDIYAHSPVYRVGGDEFVVVLEKQDYKKRDELLEKLRAAFEKTRLDSEQEPWNRYSAAAGMAVYTSGDDTDMVFNRADKEMYKAKTEMKGRS